MLDMKEIDAAISRLESGETTFSGCAKLADLYTVRDHILGQEIPYEREYSQASGPEKPEDQKTDLYGDSDFLKAVSGKTSSNAWAIIDELMDTLHVVNPKVYDSVMRKIKAL